MNVGLAGHLREAFGWREEPVLSPGPRGALGRIWRVTVAGRHYALKEMFSAVPAHGPVEAEVAFTRRVAGAGVRLPVSHPDRHGRYLVQAPDGTWLRLYDWVDAGPVEVSAPMTPHRLGVLLARLHRCAPAAPSELDGGPPDRWYDGVPRQDRWLPFVEGRFWWASRLAARLPTFAELGALVGPVDRAGLLLCHRDLHPENVLVDAEGRLVVVDWDNVGPAMPGRELARVWFDWYHDGPVSDVDAMRQVHEAYRAEGGSGRVTAPADFGMLIASRLNFLLRQLGVAADPDAEPRHREWAEREIDEALRILPTPRQLTDALALLAAV